MLSTDTLERIEGMISSRRDPFLPPDLDGRVVICELLNSFPSTAFPNLLQLHSSIKFGIRPLLYSILRREFWSPQGFTICSNAGCRKFFDVDRAGQQFCSLNVPFVSARGITGKNEEANSERKEPLCVERRKSNRIQGPNSLPQDLSTVIGH